MGSHIGELVGAILSILILISIGYFSKRAGLLKKEDNRVLNNVIIYITMPALIFRAVFEAEISASIFRIPLLAVVIVAVSMAAAFAIGRLAHSGRTTFGALLIVAAVGNTGYLGFPLTLQLFGIENLIKAVFYDLFGTVIIFFTAALAVASAYGDKEGEINILKEMLLFPPLLGLLAALLLKSTGLPDVLIDVITFLAGATVPLIMLSIGLALEVGHVGRYKLELGIVSLIKLVVAPLVALGGAMFLGLNDVDLGITVLEASMPAAMFSMIIGLKYGLDNDFLPTAIVVTTVISLVTIPLWQYVVRLLVG